MATLELRQTSNPDRRSEGLSSPSPIRLKPTRLLRECRLFGVPGRALPRSRGSYSVPDLLVFQSLPGRVPEEKKTSLLATASPEPSESSFETFIGPLSAMFAWFLAASAATLAALKPVQADRKARQEPSKTD